MQRTIVMAATILAAAGLHADDWNFTSRPNGLGGYRHSGYSLNGGQVWGRTSTDYMGGSRTTWSDGSYSRTTPNYAGGWRTTTSYGTFGSTNPNYAGGWRTTWSDGSYTRSTPNYAGGYRHTHYGADGTSWYGSTRSNGWGYSSTWRD